MTWVLREPTGGQRGRCKGDVKGREIGVGHEGCVGVCQAENGEEKTCYQENMRLPPGMEEWSGVYGNQTSA